MLVDLDAFDELMRAYKVSRKWNEEPGYSRAVFKPISRKLKNKEWGLPMARRIGNRRPKSKASPSSEDVGWYDDDLCQGVRKVVARKQIKATIIVETAYVVPELGDPADVVPELGDRDEDVVKWDDAEEWEELGECAGIHDEPDNIEVSVDDDEDEQQDAA
jgi:hypothetical protein